ncbi:MAG TPA: histidine phosphatase family protein [Nocardioidaceae bacterium]|nr:histidine phosphatase family protein [Nocardioidaceae bacterium]
MRPDRLPLFQDVPQRLVLVRHGESLGNIADREAREAGAERLDLDVRDADVDLSENGQRQAHALGSWFSALAEQERPALVLSSPYRRAHRTAQLTVEASGMPVIVDERLRERDLGIFDGLTGAGIRAAYAEEAERRRKLGKFYYQPPSGESWADVVLRVRSLLADLRFGFGDRTIWLFSHQAVIMSFRYVLEGLDEEHLLAIDQEQTLGNASLTSYERQDGHLRLVRFADDEVVRRSTAVATEEPTVADEAASRA